MMALVMLFVLFVLARADFPFLAQFAQEDGFCLLLVLDYLPTAARMELSSTVQGHDLRCRHRRVLVSRSYPKIKLKGCA